MNYELTGLPKKITAGAGSDTFTINTTSIGNFIIDGGTSVAGVDSVVKPVYYDAANTKLSTVKTTLGTPNATDNIQFNKSGVFTTLQFTDIERIDLAQGITVTLSSDQLSDDIDSLGQNGDNAIGLNPGLQFYGAGTKTATAKVIVNYEDNTFTPAATVVGAKPVTYSLGDFQLDDASTGDLFHNILNYDDFSKDSSKNSYGRSDGSNDDDYVVGGHGSTYATLRLGNDTFIGGEGNDVIVGYQGADYLNGGAGNDIFLITSFGGALGAGGKADDGNPEWINGGDVNTPGKGDVIIGGSGTDTLRITGGAATPTTVTLTDKNFIGMEVVQVGATVGKLNVEDGALQLLNNHYYQDTAGTITGTGLRAGQTADNVIVDASAIKANGLTFIGNANANTFIGTQKADTFIGNGGNDIFTGGAGADKFIFGKVHTQSISGNATTIQTYQDVASDLTGVDTITDFKSGTDKIVLNADMFTAFAGKIKLSTDDFKKFLSFDVKTHTLSYNADSSHHVDFVVLAGVSAIAASDFIVV